MPRGTTKMCSIMTAVASTKRISVSRLSRPVNALPIVDVCMAPPPHLPTLGTTQRGVESLTKAELRGHEGMCVEIRK